MDSGTYAEGYLLCGGPDEVEGESSRQLTGSGNVLCGLLVLLDCTSVAGCICGL